MKEGIAGSRYPLLPYSGNRYPDIYIELASIRQKKRQPVTFVSIARCIRLSIRILGRGAGKPPAVL